MPSFKSTVFAVAAAFVAATQADYVIEPKSVPLATRSTLFYPQVLLHRDGECGM